MILYFFKKIYGFEEDSKAYNACHYQNYGHHGNNFERLCQRICLLYRREDSKAAMCSMTNSFGIKHRYWCAAGCRMITPFWKPLFSK